MRTGDEKYNDGLGISSQTALQGFLEAAPDAIVVVDTSGRIVTVNQLTERMFGYARQELLGKTVEFLVPERYHGRHVLHRSNYFREPRTRPMGEGRELAGRRKDGSEFSVEISLSPLETDKGTLVISIIRDTTQRRQAEAKFRGLLESAPDGIIVVDRSGRIVIVNSQTERIFGYSRDELINKSIELLVPKRFMSAHVAHRNGYLNNPKTRPMGGASSTLTGRKRDGTEFPVEISLSPMHTDEGMLVTAAIRDISERKLVETRLRSSLQEKEILLKEIHHRVKNNLQIVSSMLNLQIDQISDPKALGLFKESQTRVRSIALFHEKLYQSKDLARVDIAEYLKGLATGLFATYGVNPDNILLDIQTEDVPLGVDAAISCGLIVNELVSNALKHAFPNGRRGEVRVALRREGEDVILEVADNGIGFPAEVDFRNPSTLGLKLVCILSEQVRGSIELDRREGTRFLVRFGHGAQS
ncbi:PAS domain S-box protein [Archangium sp.]|uniref:PAS domain S-box protein n=1 Tax=Archangium sp. TaxID=1872627 RepID=UPI002D4AC4C7|nr:PAS domain S-box protein [Archangium sp.]HYO51870.1 PAS domain S-box protein [Archangium sp.]